MVYFKKSVSIPTSLNTGTIYNGHDVLSLLYSDFKNKCYICESKGLESINIEHFAPHKDVDETRKYSWTNLFWACSHCNKIKSAQESLLNCTDKNDCVDVKIRYTLDDDLENNKIVIENLEQDVCTINTVGLLTKVYNGTTTQNTFQAREKRNKLYDELCDFASLVSKYTRSEDALKKSEYLRVIRLELSNESAFTAFKRWYIRDSESLKQELEQYIED